MYEVVRLSDKANTSAQRVEDVMVNLYLETREETNTVGMATYMKQRLSPLNTRYGYKREEGNKH